MEELISALEDLALQIRNMQSHLREIRFPSLLSQRLAVDAGIYGAMAASAMERLRTILVDLEEAKVEPVEPAEEEERGGDLGEQVREPEDSEAGDTTPVQEPETEGSEGD